MLVTPIAPQVIGVAPAPDPDTPVIMAPLPHPPVAENDNGGIVPPWLQRVGNAR